MKVSTPVFTLIFALPFSLPGGERNALIRFHKILCQYDNPVYSAMDRDVVGDLRYSARSYEEPDTSWEVSLTDQEHERYSMDFCGEAGVAGRQIKSSPQFQLDHSLSIMMSGTIRKESEVSGSTFSGHFDTMTTNDQRASGSVEYGGSIRRYLPFVNKPPPLFIELGGSFDATGGYTRYQSLRHDYDAYSEDLRRQRRSNLSFYGGTAVNPAIGWGKRLPVAPVYKAFEIERKLKKTGALRTSLSSETMLRLAALCGSLESFEVAHDRPDKHYLQEMERIVRNDSAVDSAKLDAFSLFKAYETFSERFPLLFYGFEVKLRPAIYVFYSYFNRDPANRDSAAMQIDVLYNLFKNPIQFGWTFPVTSRLFLEAIVEPPFSRDEDPLYHTGSIGAYFMITNWILVNASVSEIPTLLIAPCQVPGLYELSIYLYLEDRLMLRFSGFKRMRPSEALLSDFYYERNLSEGLQMQVRYDF